MNKETTTELKQLILNEMGLRKEFREKRKELEDLVSPISKHVRECCEWWENNLPNSQEIVIIMDNKTSLKLTKPTLEKCSVESYLPFGVDYLECEVIDFN
jgi:hypothetical protein